MNKSTFKLNSKTTLGELEAFLHTKDKVELANFVFDRLSERYILPLIHVESQYKNGFNILANCSLLIESYENFRLGRTDSIRSQKVFESFFEREATFESLKKYAVEFYKHVRCGILHQGETTGNWRITRKNDAQLYNDFTINANKFLESIIVVLENYKSALLNAEWEDVIWVNCIKKIRQILLNCSSYYFAYGSNMNQVRLENRVGATNVSILGRAILKNHELKFNKLKLDKSAAANVMQKRYSVVEGILYEFDASNSEILEKLDKCEGVEGKHYFRKLTSLDFNGIEVLAYVYFAFEDKIADGIFPKKDYLDHLLKAKDYLSASYYKNLLNQKTI
ncbi:gamma-glutamylcyclotransferase family protein [Aquirufa sp. OSTEICH-129V]|uniref:Gamma-glutamylcyclotransferase family protein n=1 Tax=Aquirufa avitistagni TaxID=3104728 RepID=A0ABW6DBS6_9BACT